VYKNNATLGVGKLDYIIASGTEQKNIQDVFNLESYLHLDEISPMQTSYTQAPEDRDTGGGDDPSSGTSKTKESQSPSPSSSKSAASGIEPSGDGGGEEKDDSSSSSTRDTDAEGTTNHRGD